MAATIVRRSALIVLGLLAALLSAEALLQVGAAYRAWSGRRPEFSLGSGTRILCVGDSNTYGLYLDANESYPAQLQGLLGHGVQVVNLGFPGMNSSRLRVELPAMLDAIQPSIVFILIGANDLWTAPVPVDEASQRSEGWSPWLYRHSRVYRLLFILARGLQASDASAPAVEVPRLSMESPSSPDGQEVIAHYGDHSFRLGWQPVSGEHPKQAPQLAEHLAGIIATVRAHGAQAVVLTYPSDHSVYRQISATIAARARELGAPVIDLSTQFKALCAERDCRPLFFGDGHPTEPGYHEVARMIAQWLHEQQSPASP